MPASAARVSTDLLQQLSPEFYSISIGDTKGNEIAFSGNTKNAGSTNIENNLLFEEAQKKLQPVISSANPNLKLPHRYVSLVLPVVINKQFAGCINSILDFSYFSKLITLSNNDKLWQVAVLDSQNHIIASTDLGKVETNFFRRTNGEFRYINSTMYNWSSFKPNLPPISRWQQSVYGYKFPVTDDIPWSVVVELPAKSYVNYLAFLYINNFEIVLLVGILAVESAIVVLI